MRTIARLGSTLVLTWIAFLPAAAHAADAAGYTHYQPNGQEDTGTTVQNPDGSTTTTFGSGWSVTVRTDPSGGTEIVEKDNHNIQRMRILKWPNGKMRSRDDRDVDTNTETLWVYDQNGNLIGDPKKTKIDPNTAFGTPVDFDPTSGKWHPRDQPSSGTKEAGASAVSLVITAGLAVATWAWQRRRRDARQG